MRFRRGIEALRGRVQTFRQQILAPLPQAPRVPCGGPGPRSTLVLMLSTSAALQFLLLVFAGWVSRRQQDVIAYLQEENRILREQLGGRRLRLTDAQRRRLAAKGKTLGRKALCQVAGIVTPDTILRWYRHLTAQKYEGSAKRGPGHPRVDDAIRNLVLRMAGEDVTWGYTRLVGALRNLEHTVGRSTLRRILKDHGIDPAPERGKRAPWSTFIKKAHLAKLAEADFFTVEALTLVGLLRYYVFFVIDIQTRKVNIAGISHHPTYAGCSRSPGT